MEIKTMDWMNNDSLTANYGTSVESLKASQKLARRLCDKVFDLALEAGPKGIMINEAVTLIEDHKANSVSPRFSELEKRGALVRVFRGCGRPTKRFPKGVPLYRTRYDEETRRNVNIYWVPEFAPAAPGEALVANGCSLARSKAEALGTESPVSGGVHV